MKLYVNKINGGKIYLNLIASTRSELALKIGSRYFNFNKPQSYCVKDVFAEKDTYENAETGAIIGAIIGVIGGPVGILIGFIIGLLIGNHSENSEIMKVKLFNQS